MAAYDTLFSSQGSHEHDENVLLQHLASSPLTAPSHRASHKPKKPPTVTPKRFTRFFTPRQTGSSSGRNSRPSKSGRQLRDITRNALNCSQLSGRDAQKLQGFEDVENHTPQRCSKRRKVLPTPDNSPILSSPLRRFDLDQPSVHFLDDERDRVDISENEESLADLCSDFAALPTPVRRLPSTNASQRLLQRSFGGARALGRGRVLDSCADWQDSTANFYSLPDDCHSFRGSALPFCTAPCNSNSLVAIGDEEGGIRIVDSSSADDITFSKAHVSFKPHNNAVMDIAFSSDDYLFATASGDQTARVIDMRTQQTRYIMAGHISSVKQVRFQPGNDSILATSSRDGSVQIWDLRCRGSDTPAKDFRVALDPDTRDGVPSRHQQVIYANTCISIRDAHASTATSNPGPSGQPLFATKSEMATRRNDVSITALSFLPTGREHLLLTASEANASIKLWDIRGKYTSRRGPAIPVSATREPDSHNRHRHFGLNSLILNGDGSRLYALCKDSTVYAYSTNHIILGQAPELSSAPPKWRRPATEGALGLGPLHGFRHPQFHATSFYVKASMRVARGVKDEMLAVGSRDGCAVLFPTDENLFKRRQPARTDDDDDELPASVLPKRPVLSRTASGARFPQDTLPIYEQGTALVRGHQSEVTSLTWTADGELVTVGDDFQARCWREGPQARDLRVRGEAEGRRWACGWANVSDRYDEEE